MCMVVSFLLLLTGLRYTNINTLYVDTNKHTHTIYYGKYMFSNMFRLSLVLCLGYFVLRYVYFILFVHDYYASCVKGTLYIYKVRYFFCYCVVSLSTKQSTL